MGNNIDNSKPRLAELECDTNNRLQLHKGAIRDVLAESRAVAMPMRTRHLAMYLIRKNFVTGGGNALARILNFARATRAASAVEFGLIAAPFVALLLAILQVGVVFIAQQVLQTATNQAARLIMTGQAQTQDMTATQFQQQVCAHATALFNCSALYVNVQTFSSFSSVSMTNPVNNGQFNAGNLQFSPGGSGDIVVAQVFYQWPVFLGPLGLNLSNLNDNQLLLVGTAAFRNEPY